MGDEARYMENLTLDEIGRDCTILLKYFTGKKDIPLPTKIRRSQWNNYKWTYGSYSYRPTFCDNIKCYAVNLTEPITNDEKVPRILFAGEGTSLAYYSTAHGTFLSGRKQAEK